MRDSNEVYKMLKKYLDKEILSIYSEKVKDLYKNWIFMFVAKLKCAFYFCYDLQEGDKVEMLEKINEIVLKFEDKIENLEMKKYLRELLESKVDIDSDQWLGAEGEKGYVFGGKIITDYSEFTLSEYSNNVDALPTVQDLLIAKPLDNPWINNSFPHFFRLQPLEN